MLLADSGITSLLGSASATPTEAGQFAFVQDFLAQTAMISSEAPNLARSLVIAPPTGWDPSPAEAAALLSITHNAPWLHSVVAVRPRGANGDAAVHAAAREAGERRRAVRHLPRPPEAGPGKRRPVHQPAVPAARLAWSESLDAALAATASAAWRGSGSPGGWLATDPAGRLPVLLRAQGADHPAGKKLFLAGTSGETPVSVRNGLGLAGPGAGGGIDAAGQPASARARSTRCSRWRRERPIPSGCRYTPPP